jgi:tRNA dimethylallyltransferase
MKNLIIVTGPTASGKTAVAIDLALKLNCGIISADSRQFYMGMTIGTAAPTEHQMERAKHYFVGFLKAEEYYSASMFERDVLNLLPELFEKSDYAIMTGGSGLYIDAVCNGIDDIPDVDPEIRDSYISKFHSEGLSALRAELRLVDPEHYRTVDLKNPRRIMRALEIYASTGRPYSSFLTRDRQKRWFNIIKTGIMPEREELYRRINERVDLMVEEGLEGEARGLYPLRNLNSLQTVGYREMFEWFDGNITREEAVELIKRNTRRYARRQITWWSKDKSVKWFVPGQEKQMADYVESSATHRNQG